MEFISDLFYDVEPTQLFTTIVIIFAVWLAIRELKCWYWKVNDILECLEKQNELSEEILNELKKQNNKTNNKSTP